MNVKKEYQSIMNDCPAMALATANNNQPNVRIVNFAMDEQKPNVLYFSTFPQSQKVQELMENAQVALTTIPNGNMKHVKISVAQAIRSEKSIYDVAELFTNKIPDYAENIAMFGDVLLLFEVHFTTARVTLDMKNSEVLEFNEEV